LNIMGSKRKRRACAVGEQEKNSAMLGKGGVAGRRKGIQDMQKGGGGRTLAQGKEVAR